MNICLMRIINRISCGKSTITKVSSFSQNKILKM